MPHLANDAYNTARAHQTGRVREAEQFILTLYRGILGREADQPGFEHYVTALLSGVSHTAIVQRFIASEEYIRKENSKVFRPHICHESDAREDAEQFIIALYRGVLDREPDQSGFKHYVNALFSGTTHTAIAKQFIASEEYVKKQSSKLFRPPGHFYSPIVNPLEADRHLAALESNPTPESVPGLMIDRDEMIRVWRGLLPFITTAPFQESKRSPFRYAFENPNYAWGDGSVLYAMILHHRPKRIIEIGSGWSSACMLDTVERYLDSDCELTFVEPDPARLLLKLIGEAASRVRIFDKPVQEVPLSIFDTLQASDILFIESTHVMRTGSDVCFELFEILPRLSCGVFVHFHDMFWPFEYPRVWAVEENRSWNELYAVRAFLSYNSTWRIILFNSYLAKLEQAMIEATYPTFLGQSGSALWLQRS